MRAVYVLVEGPTEEEFVNNSLAPYLLSHNIYDVRAIKISTSVGYYGGDFKYSRFKPNVKILLASESDVIVTSLFDFYKIRNDFPLYDEAVKLSIPQKKVELIEKGCFDEIANDRFIPYIQLYEFEGLLFASNNAFDLLFPKLDKNAKNELEKIFSDFPNPELINDGFDTCPSNRIKKIIPNYRKTLHGPMIVLENGFEVLLEKCPRFNNWVNAIITRFYS